MPLLLLPVCDQLVSGTQVWVPETNDQYAPTKHMAICYRENAGSLMRCPSQSNLRKLNGKLEDVYSYRYQYMDHVT